MAKAKVKRKSTMVDMTAMTDVAFLLLTFFMLTAKAVPNEPVQVDIPSSVSETKLPESNTITILVDKEGKAYLDFAGVHSRERIAQAMNSGYNLGFTADDVKSFVGAGSFGVPIKDLKSYLRTDGHTRGEFKQKGIPKDSTTNELGPWLETARRAQWELKKEGVVDSEYVIVVKADATTPYPAVQEVINTLTDFNINKFNLITNLKADPNKKPE